MERNRISQKSVFKGSITSQGDFRIDGTIEGDLITTGKVIIGPEGKVLGEMKCVNADVEGTFDGRLEVKNSLCLKPSAKVYGEVLAESFTVEPGAVINANCSMLSAVKELKPSSKVEEKSNESKQGKASKVS
ncbi:polymer-forming cytoskeletal protein [Wenyingzhuangia sp. 2_MG-2023]|uniref:bactofilin family protein n=1 Tax=Wenyingzhuangia sp. 2_MG-2023 TaxID=3062639 RepID=UPI0026E3C24B|nr:polymer-forming cytoskeletal protein [Wenyingzhuangia sp. 2_MG-2023]MDO6736744.1 polymer-forming cytoskeletal protein [Wenyingzhuangia sp. 2_MG-2023]